MSDRIKGCEIVFEKDFKEEDARPIMDAIRHIRGVIAVEPSVTSGDDWSARERVRNEIRENLLNLYNNI